MIYPSAVPLSIEENWARILDIEKEAYCTLIGHDDLLEVSYLEEMKRLILHHPDASLYTSSFQYIDASGKLIRNSKKMKARYSPEEFLSAFLSNSVDSMGTGFMMKSSDYDRIGGIPTRYPNLLFADFELWINLARLSYVVATPEICFSFRLHQSMTTISSDLKLKEAFFRFLDYLFALKTSEGKLAHVISEGSINFIEYYCRGLSHRLIKANFSKRKGLTVAALVKECRKYAILLSGKSKWIPWTSGSILLASVIDSNSVTRNGFLMFKKVFPKPLLN